MYTVCFLLFLLQLDRWENELEQTLTKKYKECIGYNQERGEDRAVEEKVKRVSKATKEVIRCMLWRSIPVLCLFEKCPKEFNEKLHLSRDCPSHGSTVELYTPIFFTHQRKSGNKKHAWQVIVRKAEVSKAPMNRNESD